MLLQEGELYWLHTPISRRKEMEQRAFLCATVNAKQALQK